MIIDPNPGRETITTTLDDSNVWREITRVARAALRQAESGDQAGPATARMRAAVPAGETWDVRAQPLLQIHDDRTVVIVAIERIVSAGEMAAPAPMTVPMAFVPTRQPVPVVEMNADLDADVDSIRDRFGLSQRQAEVARLLALRLTDKEIAARLGVSRHTARRHVELTMIRLRVHSRAEVGDLIAGAA